MSSSFKFYCPNVSIKLYKKQRGFQGFEFIKDSLTWQVSQLLKQKCSALQAIVEKGISFALVIMDLLTCLG